MTTHALINTVDQCVYICVCSSSAKFTNPLQEAPLHACVHACTCVRIFQWLHLHMFPPRQVNSAMAHRKLAVCTRYWRCPTRGRTCPCWSFSLGRRCHWLPWSPSSKHRCWRSGPTMSNGRRWRSTYRGKRWHTHKHTVYTNIRIHPSTPTYGRSGLMKWHCLFCLPNLP